MKLLLKLLSLCLFVGMMWMNLEKDIKEIGTSNTSDLELLQLTAVQAMAEDHGGGGGGGYGCNSAAFHFYTISWSSDTYCYNNCASSYFMVRDCGWYSPFNTCTEYYCSGSCASCILM
jgi:hypothetical protein